MGKPLRPRCVATNQEYVYFVATAVRHNNSGQDHGDILTALVRSERLPASLANTTWTLVSTFPEPMRYHRSMDCNVDRAGVFSLRYLNSTGYTRYTFNPIAPIRSGQTYTKDNNTHGEWSQVTMEYPTEAAYMTTRHIQPEDENGAAEMLVYYSPTSMALPPARLPSFSTGLYNKVGEFNRTTISNTSVSTTNGAIFNLQYGDGQVFVILKTGQPFQYDGSYKTYNTTLVHFPFTPQNTFSPKRISVPWRAQCDDRDIYDDMALVRVARGKFYYLCSMSTNSISSNLYIHDSKTNLTQGPWSIPDYVLDMSLAYGSSGPSDPQFAIVTTNLDTLAIDLRSSTNSTLSWVRISNNTTVSENLKTPMPPPETCNSESCAYSKALEKLIIVAAAVVLLFLAGCWCWCCHRRAKHKRRREAVVQTAPLTHRPGHEVDVELPAYSAREVPKEPSVDANPTPPGYTYNP